jgi:hypothetical protein
LSSKCVSKNQHQISVYVVIIFDFERDLDTIKVLDTRHRGVPTEAYE